MKIKINKTLEAVFLFLLAVSIACTVTYFETQRLTAHFMQIKTMELISYEPQQQTDIQQPATSVSASSVSSAIEVTKRILTPRPFTTTTKTVFEVVVPPKVTPTQKRIRRSSSSSSLSTSSTSPVLELEQPKPAASDFPALERAIYPIAKAPNWGAMRTEAEWNRIYGELNDRDFVEIPPYDLSVLTIPMQSLTQDLTAENVARITTKLFYSTRFMGRYDLDSGEYEGSHAGIDFKLAAGTPVVSIAGGVVHATGVSEDIGNYVMILHRLPDSNEEVVSIYGHLDRVSAEEGQVVRPGTIIGSAGSTGKSLSPHLHLQIDKKKNPGRHSLYIPGSQAGNVSDWTIHPIEFIQQW